MPGSIEDSRGGWRGDSVAELRELASYGHTPHWPCTRAEGKPWLYSTEAYITNLPNMLRMLSPPQYEILSAANHVLSKLRPSYTPTMTKKGLSQALEPSQVCVGAASRVCVELFDVLDPIPMNMTTLQTIFLQRSSIG